ncbi:hypothetical protein J6590_052728 [Homalodisca vitripennis]|nr:hypothetical protein J6590_052728 [Homalodisca vitripennis]
MLLQVEVVQAAVTVGGSDELRQIVRLCRPDREASCLESDVKEMQLERRRQIRRLRLFQVTSQVVMSIHALFYKAETKPGADPIYCQGKSAIENESMNMSRLVSHTRHSRRDHDTPVVTKIRNNLLK